MDNVQPVQTAEEIEQEQIALHLPKEEEVRASVITEFGFDEELDIEKIDKAVAKEMEQRTKLSEAIGQKIKERTAKETLLKEKSATLPTKLDVKIDAEEVGKVVDIKVTETLEKRDLNALEYPDELKAEISKLAKLNGVSIKQALKDPYIVFKIEAYEKEEKTEQAKIGRTHKSFSSTEFDINNPPEFNPDDIPGYDKRMAEWTAEAKKRGF